MIATGKLINVILWGPSGTGKTSIIKVLANSVNAIFRPINATTTSVKEIRSVIAESDKSDLITILFIDECNRLSSNQWDVLLPVIEEGRVVVFGATTEKPKFAVNSAILSRCIVLETKPLNDQEMLTLLLKVKSHYKNNGRSIKIEPSAAKRLITRCSGDARKAITVLETCVEILSTNNIITIDDIDTAMPEKHIIFDANGNDHFDLARCYQTAIQHSDVNGALYWLGKWLASGEDITFICRRMLISAFEDCAGNPDAWLAAMTASYAAEKTGMPECMIPLSVATCEMANSQRNRSGYDAIKSVMNDIENNTTVHVDVKARTGYVGQISKQYLKEWKKDTDVKPTVEQKEFLYAVGNGSMEMTDGPHPDINQMLSVIGTYGDFIFECKNGKMERIYEWFVDDWQKL